MQNEPLAIIENPPIARALASDVRWSWIWLVLRLYVEWSWRSEGMVKAQTPARIGSERALQRPPAGTHVSEGRG